MVPEDDGVLGESRKVPVLPDDRAVRVYVFRRGDEVGLAGVLSDGPDGDRGVRASKLSTIVVRYGAGPRALRACGGSGASPLTKSQDTPPTQGMGKFLMTND